MTAYFRDLHRPPQGTAGGEVPRGLAQFSPSNRLLVVLFLVSLGSAFVGGMVNYFLRTGLTMQGTLQYYRGDEQELLLPKTPRELMDITHVHLFGLPVALYLLCHTFSLTRVPDRRKSLLYAAAFGGMFLDLSAPWCIRFLSPACVVLLPLSSLLLGISFLLLILVPLWEIARTARAGR